MVDVGVGQEYIVDLTVAYRKLCIDIWIVSLLHSAVDQHSAVSDLKKMTASSNFMIRSDKG